MSKDYDEQGYLDNTIVNDMFRNPYNTWVGEKIELLAREVLCRRNNQKWVSVRDRQPENSGKYLVNRRGIGVSCEKFNIPLGCWMCDWVSSITHWMPLPEPPESEEE